VALGTTAAVEHTTCMRDQCASANRPRRDVVQGQGLAKQLAGWGWQHGGVARRRAVPCCMEQRQGVEGAPVCSGPDRALGAWPFLLGSRLFGQLQVEAFNGPHKCHVSERMGSPRACSAHKNQGAARPFAPSSWCTLTCQLLATCAAVAGGRQQVQASCERTRQAAAGCPRACPAFATFP